MKHHFPEIGMSHLHQKREDRQRGALYHAVKTSDAFFQRQRPTWDKCPSCFYIKVPSWLAHKGATVRNFRSIHIFSLWKSTHFRPESGHSFGFWSVKKNMSKHPCPAPAPLKVAVRPAQPISGFSSQGFKSRSRLYFDGDSTRKDDNENKGGTMFSPETGDLLIQLEIFVHKMDKMTNQLFATVGQRFGPRKQYSSSLKNILADSSIVMIAAMNRSYNTCSICSSNGYSKSLCWSSRGLRLWNWGACKFCDSVHFKVMERSPVWLWS